MDRKEFAAQPEVTLFVDWLAEYAPQLDIHLQIKSSRFVPNGINEVAHGLDAVLSHYFWLQDWAATQQTIAGFRADLKDALNSRPSSDLLLSGCKRILIWGGDRNPNQGAWKFLSDLPDVVQYIGACRQELQLRSANLGELNTVTKMNSMLSKVHAFACRRWFANLRFPRCGGHRGFG